MIINSNETWSASLIALKSLSFLNLRVKSCSASIIYQRVGLNCGRGSIKCEGWGWSVRKRRVHRNKRASCHAYTKREREGGL